MDFLLNILSPFVKLLKKFIRWTEVLKYKQALRRNPQDNYLRARYAKYCLNSYFQDTAASRVHVVEAVNQFENIVYAEVLDLEVFYLMGKFYQGNDNPKAIDIYRKGIKRYNDFVAKSLEFRHEQVETAFTIALNLLSLESNHADPELEKFFKNLRRTYLKNFLDHKVNFNPDILGTPPGIHPIVN